MFGMASMKKRGLCAKLLGGALFLPLLFGLDEGCPEGSGLFESSYGYDYGYADGWDYYGDGGGDNWSHSGYGGHVGGDGETFYFIDGDSSYISGP